MTISRWGMASRGAAAFALTAGLGPASAGPPFETDDPAPTDLRRWEVYLFADAGGRGAEFDGAGGLDVNYGLRPGLQLTATVPLRIAFYEGSDVAVGDVDLAAKYRFLKDGRSGWSAAIAGIVTVPVLAGDAGPRHLAARVPLWIGWERGNWSLYGGGGRSFSGEAGVRDLWFGGLVATRAIGSSRVGVEVTRRGAEAADAPGETGVAIGCLVPLTRPFLFHAAVGPRFVDGEATRYRFYIAVAASF